MQAIMKNKSGVIYENSKVKSGCCAPSKILSCKNPSRGNVDQYESNHQHQVKSNIEIDIKMIEEDPNDSKRNLILSPT